MIKKVCQVVETVNDPKVKRREQTGISKNIKLYIEKIEKISKIVNPNKVVKKKKKIDKKDEDDEK